MGSQIQQDSVCEPELLMLILGIIFYWLKMKHYFNSTLSICRIFYKSLLGISVRDLVEICDLCSILKQKKVISDMSVKP